jgi:hypothetical protein
MQSETDAGPANDNSTGTEEKMTRLTEPHPALRVLARLLARQAARDFVNQTANDNQGAKSENKGD